MGLFDFFKKKEKAVVKMETEKPAIQPNEQAEFVLTLADFSEKIHRSSVVLADAWIDPEFANEFALGTPMKKGDVIELKTQVAKVILEEQIVEITFDPDHASKNINNFIQKLNQQLNWLTKNKSIVNEVIIRDLLILKNDSWLDENLLPVSEKDFLKSIRLISIDFIKNAAFELYFDDGYLFFGHSIRVSVNAKGEVKEAVIEG